MTNYTLRRLFQKLDELGYLDYDSCFDKYTSVKNLIFSLDRYRFSVESIFLNDIYNPEIAEEELDIHLAFKYKNILCELIWQDYDRSWSLQSTYEDIKKLFPQYLFKERNRVYFMTLSKGLEPIFIVDDKEVDFSSLKLKIDKTPDDYSDIKHHIYISIGGKRQNLVEKDKFANLLSNFIDIDSIKEATYGYSLMLCTQQIPEVIDTLIKNNIAIYEVSFLNKEQ